VIAAIVFDKDGTLFDFEATWAGWTAGLLAELSEGEGALAGRLAGAIGFDLPTRRFHPESPVIAATPVEIAAAMLPHLPRWGAGALVDRMNARAADARQAEVVPLRPLLVHLRAGGLRLGLVTNDGEAPARAHLAGAGISDLFDFVAGSDSGHGAKPAPGQLLAFARATGVAPGATVMVGDSLHDLHAGRAAGMRAVGVLTGLAAHHDLAPHADAVLPDIGALPGWLATLPQRQG
jgi:phosphoglycolate phosphatase